MDESTKERLQALPMKATFSFMAEDSKTRAQSQAASRACASNGPG